MLRPPLAIRPYRPVDLDTLYQIDQACYPPGIAYSKRTLRLFLRVPGAICLVAESGAEIVGFIIAEQEERTGHIITLDVLEPYRRHRMGTALLEAAESQLASRGVQTVELETATDNAPAIAFWQKHGYRTRGILERYYLGRVDALSMEKSLHAAQET